MAGRGGPSRGGGAGGRGPGRAGAGGGARPGRLDAGGGRERGGGGGPEPRGGGSRAVELGRARCGGEGGGEGVNAGVHGERAGGRGGGLAAERAHLHVLPAEPYVLALGEERLVNDDQTVRFGSVRYSTPPGHVGDRVWCRVHGTELVIVARAGAGLAEITRHRLSTPGNPRICDEHYPHHPGGNGPRRPRPRARTPAEQAFLELGEG